MSVRPQLYLSVVPSPILPGLPVLVHPKCVTELPSKILVTNQPLSGKSAVGLSVGFRVGEVLGDLVGVVVGAFDGLLVGDKLGERVGLVVGSGGITGDRKMKERYWWASGVNGQTLFDSIKCSNLRIPVISNSAKLTPV